MSIRVEGKEITREDIGKFLIVTKSCRSNSELPVGHRAKILGIESDYVDVLDAEGDWNEIYPSDVVSTGLKLGKGFEQAIKSTVPQRKKLAKAIKEAKEVLVKAIEEAKAVGMEVDLTGDSITFQPPQEKY